MSATTHTDTHAWNAVASRSRGAAFRAARRHSRWVRFLRRAIPVGIVSGMGLYALSAWLNPLAGLSRLPSIGKVTMTGSKVTMELPRLAGFTRDGRSYELTASAAAQDLSQPQLIELKDLRAKVELQDKNVVNVTAQAGIYDTKSEAVSLSQNIVVASPGYEVRLSEALLDMKKGTVVSQKPVEVLLPGGRLNANQLEVQESGDVVVFRGGVTMHLEAQRTSAEPGPQERGP